MSESDQEMCSICLDDIYIKKHIHTCCGHKFHGACIQAHIISYRKETCPMCRHKWSRRGECCSLVKTEFPDCVRGCMSRWSYQRNPWSQEFYDNLTYDDAAVINETTDETIGVSLVVIEGKEYYTDDHKNIYDTTTLDEIGVVSFYYKRILFHGIYRKK